MLLLLLLLLPLLLQTQGRKVRTQRAAQGFCHVRPLAHFDKDCGMIVTEQGTDAVIARGIQEMSMGFCPKWGLES